MLFSNLKQINQKNAFEINLDYLEEISKMYKKSDEQSWQKCSGAIDASTKVYGIRVDSMHNDMYKYLGGLNRGSTDEKDNAENDENKFFENEEEGKKTKKKMIKGINTLETNLSKLNLKDFHSEEEIDPLFSVMTAKYNDSNVRGLLLYSMPMNYKNLNYKLDNRSVDKKQLLAFQKKKKEEREGKVELVAIEEEQEEKGGSGEEEEKSEVKSSNKESSQIVSNIEEEPQIDCQKSWDGFPENIMDELKSFIQNNHPDVLKRQIICPDLRYFRAKDLIPKENPNSNFIIKFKQALNEADGKMTFEEAGHGEGEFDVEDEENNYKGLSNNNEDDIVNDINDHGIEEGEIDGNDGLGLGEENINNDSNNNDEEQENDNMNDNILNNISNNAYNNLSTFMQNGGATNSFSLFKYDDLINRIEQFGDGNQQILNNNTKFKNFTNDLNKLDKKIIGINAQILNKVKNEDKKKSKKEEKLIEISKTNKVKLNTIFSDMSKKIKSHVKTYDIEIDGNKSNLRNKVKYQYNFDKVSLFQCFTCKNKSIFGSKPAGNENKEENNENIDKNLADEEVNNFSVTNAPSKVSQSKDATFDFNTNNSIEDDFIRQQKELDKNYQRIFRRINIKSLKNKLWKTYQLFNGKETNFDELIFSMKNNMEPDERDNLTNATAFVCLLHLCNEHNLYIKQEENSEKLMIGNDKDNRSFLEQAAENVRNMSVINDDNKESSKNNKNNKVNEVEKDEGKDEVIDEEKEEAEKMEVDEEEL